MKVLTNFHRKVLRGILKLGSRSPIPPLYFLLGEPPIEVTMHLDILTLFWCIWANHQTKIHEIVKYLLKMSDSSSLTWTAHVRILCSLYNLPDPLQLILSPPWSKEKWKNFTQARILSHHEHILRIKASENYKLQFL